MSALHKAMLDAQKEIGNAVKDSKNPHFKNDYASLSSVLDAIKPVLNRNGLVLVQQILPGETDGTVIVSTGVIHAESGESLCDKLPVPLPKMDPQGLGSAITYGRRYGLQALFAIASEDDDGNAASAPPKVIKGGSAAEVTKFDKPEPADPGAVKAMTQKLNSTLGFTPNASKTPERK